MMPILTRCEHCDHRMNVDSKYAGKKVRCPRCQEPMRVPDGAQPRIEEEDDDRPRPVRRKKRKPAANNNALWIGVGVALTLLVVVAVVVVIAVKQPARSVEDLAAGLSEPTNPATFPELSPSADLLPGVRFQSAVLSHGAAPMKVWYYRPEQATGKVPLVLVPPAGSTLVAGMELSDGDRDEHIPYVQAGFAVASFEIDGPMPNTPFMSDATIVECAREFRDARAGLKNAKAALDFLLAKANGVDETRIFVAGHSSAGTLALLLAEHEPRIKGCAAYSAVSDVDGWLGPIRKKVTRGLPGYVDFLRFSSPKTHVEKLKCPVFLFHPRDDSTVPVAQTLAFAQLLKQTNPDVTVVTPAKGDHYDAMISAGIPQCIEWLRKR